MSEPSHLTFIKQYLNWERARERLSRYKHIAEIFPITELQNCANKAPFYCHYLSWRLGTWQNEGWFEFFDKLLAKCVALPGWDRNSHVPGGCEFDKFWGFVWELQTAVFFADSLRLKTVWRESGPDFQISGGTKSFFVECTTYRKSFALEEFIGELFHCIHPDIITAHTPCIQFSLPKNHEIENFLDDLFKPYLDPLFLQRKFIELKRQTPIILHVPSKIKNYFVYLENLNATDHIYEMEGMLTSSGDPELFLKTAHNEIFSNKASANNLEQMRPNLLMVNFLLGRDWQLASSLRNIPEPNLGETIDGVLFTACSIDQIPSIENSFIRFKPGHPLGYITKKSQYKKCE